MATPLTHDTWLRILRAEGVRVAEYPGWRTRERDDETGKPFGPVHLFLNHHTAGRSSLNLVARDGVPGLPPPLAHIHLNKAGLATMCSAGRANHAGPMALNAYTSFRVEKAVHPRPDRSSGTVDGNDLSYGLETENEGDGTDVYPRVQYDAIVRINAAVCRYHGWSANSCAGHLETSVEGKVDPRGPVAGYGARGRFTLTMAQLRKDIDERLAHETGWDPEDDVALSENDLNRIAERVVNKLLAGGGALEDSDISRIMNTDGLIKAPDNSETAGTNTHWTLASHVHATTTAVRDVREQARSNGAQLTELKTAVAAIAAHLEA